MYTNPHWDYNGHVSIRAGTMGEGVRTWWVTFFFYISLLCCLPEEKMVIGCTIARRQASFVTMFCWETMGPTIHADEKYHLPKYCCRPETSFHTVFPNGSGVFQQDDVLSHTAKMDQEWQEEHNNKLNVWLGLQIPQIVIYSSIWDVLVKQVCRTEGSNANCLVADTVALLQRSCGLHSMTGQSCAARCDACGYNVMANVCLSAC